ncbi:hypothetical protein L1S32_00530 [Methanogenium sp. S4BF]|uniref:hypothetical protein n=1 Tax=Methanogenium sp. S4BF TaxID=1789226 RepID=UPI0024160478|nr:hypothetical protein [Methanogenium sp. S4BF]WFN34641.1 hypothetical protein L1S32_00530 [Methanogenium sp. S4BF]
MQQNVIQPAEYCERGLLTVVTAPRPLLEETLAALLLRESGGAVVITCGRVRDGAFVQAVNGRAGAAALRAGTPSQLTSLVRTRNAPLFVVVHDPEIYEDDEESAARVAAMLREYAWSCANRIVLLARPGDAYLDVIWPYAGRYLYIEHDCEWKNGRVICDRQMTLDVVG